MAIITVFNQKGGVGKTTTTLNVTAALDIGQRCPMAIDADPQGNLTIACGVHKVASEQSLAAFFRHKTPLANLLQSAQRGWQLVPSGIDLSKIDALLSNDPKAAVLLRQGLKEELALTGAPILIDCCPMLNTLTLNALLACDRVLIPVAADFLSLQGVNRLDAALNVLEKKLGRSLERRIVITRFDARRKLSFDICDKLKAHYGSLVCQTRIAENVSLAASPMKGQDIFAFAPQSVGAHDYMALTKELWNDGFFA